MTQVHDVTTWLRDHGLAGHAHAVADDEYPYVAVSYDSRDSWTIHARTSEDLLAALTWLSEQDLQHARLTRHDDGYVHEPTGVFLLREHVSFPGGGYVRWPAVIGGVDCRFDKVSQFRHLLRELVER